MSTIRALVQNISQCGGISLEDTLEEQMAIVEVSSRVLNTYVVDSIVVCEAYHRLLIVGL